ncbi:MAG: UDP-N-acetylmuramoyl-L-alanyl-D-glutamate--2,6-diaminopimelate ligase [Myxococcota bacterium]
MRKRLSTLVDGLEGATRAGPDVWVEDVVTDSRRVTSNALFVALRGDRTDGHRFLEGALAAGAAALLVEGAENPVPRAAPHVRVPNTRVALPQVAARIHDHPGESMTLVGVTGTNGKTSTVRMLEAILRSGGRRAGSLTTISLRSGATELPSELTTPEADSLQRSLARMRDSGDETAILEVSSHALVRDRVGTLHFAVAIFTNLSQDHLDFHGDMQRYEEAKRDLFTPRYLKGTAIVNGDDSAGRGLIAALQRAERPLVTFGRGPGTEADVRTIEEHVRLEGARMVVEDRSDRYEVTVPLPGDFQVSNALAAISAARTLGVDPQAIVRGLRDCPPVPGRLERVSDDLPVVLVDYAHTPDALDRVLASIRPLVKGRLLVVFGCGGDRDRGKRALMAQAACRNCHYVIATSDNPRTESPEAILKEVAKGLSGEHSIIPDRRSAIAEAVEMAELDDVVVIAGKGHETQQLVGSDRLPFDDREEARAALRARESRR